MTATPANLAPIAEEAIKFVAPGASRLPGFSVDTEGQPPDSDGYYLFNAEWSGFASGGSGHIDSLFISKYDGDVWDGVTCGRLSSTGILKAQRLLRQKLKSKGADMSLHKPPTCASER